MGMLTSKPEEDRPQWRTVESEVDRLVYHGGSQEEEEEKKSKNRPERRDDVHTDNMRMSE